MNSKLVSGPMGQPTSQSLTFPSLSIPWRDIKQFAFLLIFYLCFWLSGILTMISIEWLPVDYRMGLSALLIVPLLFKYRIKSTPVTISFVTLVTIVLISAIVNNSPLSNVALFLRIPFFSFMIYILVEITINSKFLLRVMKMCVPLTVVQLPVLLFERAIYEQLPQSIRNEVSAYDFDFGTFNFKGDSKMTFFLNMMVIFLLFNPNSALVTKRRGILAIWATITVMVANSEIAKVAVLLVWGFYFLTKLNRKFTWRLIFAAAIAVIGFSFAGYTQEIFSSLSLTLQRTATGLGGDPASVQSYLEGSYSRGGAIYYYLNSDLLLVGDGPSRYSNPIARELQRGDVGHVFNFYSEIGLLGLLTSIVIFALIVFHSRGWRFRLGFQPLLMFGVMMIFTFTLQAMNDISVMLAYCLFAKCHLLSELAKPAPLATPLATQYPTRNAIEGTV